MDQTPRIALVLSGGNALGAYLAGAYEHLHNQNVRPDWIVGTSIGAVTGAILAGNAPEERLAKLNQFWTEAMVHTLEARTVTSKGRQIYNGLHTALTLMFGRPSIFRDRLIGLWSILPWVPNDIALYDQTPLRRTLERLVDFDRLNRAEVRFTAVCVDIETGEEVYFDNTRETIRPEHILASAAIPPAFPPVEIDGRLLCDAGYTNNLALDLPLREQADGDLLCIAVELCSLRAPRPASLDAVAERAHDLIFASATRRSIEALKREYALRERYEADGPQVKLVHLAYQAASHELAAKTFDYSPSSIRDRWAAGERDMASGLALLETAKDEGRFQYLAIDPKLAAAAAEAGATGAALELGSRVGWLPFPRANPKAA
jgi:NTE family protein